MTQLSQTQHASSASQRKETHSTADERRTENKKKSKMDALKVRKEEEGREWQKTERVSGLG